MVFCLGAVGLVGFGLFCLGLVGCFMFCFAWCIFFELAALLHLAMLKA